MRYAVRDWSREWFFSGVISVTASQCSRRRRYNPWPGFRNKGGLMVLVMVMIPNELYEYTIFRAALHWPVFI